MRGVIRMIPIKISRTSFCQYDVVKKEYSRRCYDGVLATTESDQALETLQVKSIKLHIVKRRYAASSFTEVFLITLQSAFKRLRIRINDSLTYMAAKLSFLIVECDPELSFFNNDSVVTKTIGRKTNRSRMKCSLVQYTVASAFIEVLSTVASVSALMVVLSLPVYVACWNRLPYAILLWWICDND